MREHEQGKRCVTIELAVGHALSESPLRSRPLVLTGIGPRPKSQQPPSRYFLRKFRSGKHFSLGCLAPDEHAAADSAAVPGAIVAPSTSLAGLKFGGIVDVDGSSVGLRGRRGSGESDEGSENDGGKLHFLDGWS